MWWEITESENCNEKKRTIEKKDINEFETIDVVVLINWTIYGFMDLWKIQLRYMTNKLRWFNTGGNGQT